MSNGRWHPRRLEKGNRSVVGANRVHRLGGPGTPPGPPSAHASRANGCRASRERGPAAIQARLRRTTKFGGWSIVVAIRRKSTTLPSGASGLRVRGGVTAAARPGDVAVDAVLAALGRHAGGLRRRLAGLGVAAEHLGDGCLRLERATRRALPTGRATTGPVAAGCMGPEGRAATGRCSLPLASRIRQRHRQSPGAERSGSARVGCSAG